MDGAGTLAARALEQAASLGDASIASVGERDLTAAMLPLAAHTGSVHAETLLAPDGGCIVRVMGEVSVRRGGSLVALPKGQPGALLRLLAVNPAGLAIDEVIETFWPDEDADTGRRRVRGALSRLRSRTGDLITRHGSQLRLAASWVDSWTFRDTADRALASRGVDAESLAVAALALWTGDLLPGDPYESWAARPREQLRRRRLDLLDLVARRAAGRGSLDEARLTLEQAIEVDPYDETRYVRAARHLLAQGRREPARRMLTHAQTRLDEIGLNPTRELQDAINEVNAD
jgi:DNA-binding SARP family transcriptional activator